MKKDFPPGLLQIEDSYYLHDARIRGLGQRADAFVVMLQLDTPPQSLLTFTYDLLEPPQVQTDALPEQFRSKGAVPEWQYDEVEMVEGTPPTWRQAILLSNGWEITLHFRDIRVEEAQALLPTPVNGTDASSSLLPQSARS